MVGGIVRGGLEFPRFSGHLGWALAEPTDLHHELVEPDGVAFAAFDIDPPRLVPCLDLPHQLAQKVHACTEPIPGGNHRVRDVIDIWLLEALLSDDALELVRAAAVETFRRRCVPEEPDRPDPHVGLGSVTGPSIVGARR